MTPVSMTIRCSNCGQPFPTSVRTVVDANQDPEGKSLLITGRLNQAICPHCNATNLISAPILYHDASKELLLAFVPPQLGIKHGGEEKVVGDLLNELTRNLPQGSFKGYMLNPKRVLTVQGMIDQILQADGITPEMLEQQRQRVELIQKLLETHPDQLPQVIQAHDGRIDRDFLMTMTAMVQRVAQAGQRDLAEHLLAVQNLIVMHSSYGQEVLRQQQEQEKIIAEVAQQLNALGENATREQFLNLVLSYREDSQRLQALVGLARPVFDYQFFQELSAYIGKAPQTERDALEAVRDQLLKLTETIDKQTQSAMQNAARFLQMLVNSPNPDALIQENIARIDDVFMQVLSINLQESERRGDSNTATRLRDIYNRVIGVLQAQMQPELRFVNQLLNTQSEAEVRNLLQSEAKTYGPVLLEVMDAVGEILQSQGQHAALQKLAFIREEASAVLE